MLGSRNNTGRDAWC